MKSKLKLKKDKTANDLQIIYRNEKLFDISNRGQCWFGFNLRTLDLYADWVKNGCLVSEKIVKWRGGKYKLQPFGILLVLLRIDIKSGQIFEFYHMNTCKDCKDDNLIRHEQNGAIVIF